ncbi:MAG: hypothetical protein L0Y70_29240 [Gemmataceae bacterium]|nr:hypothetical protein [Gemmataceae bacterium]
MSPLRWSSALALFLFAVSLASAQEQSAVPAGHSMHGEAFNAGPRQAAYLLGGTGKVKFPITAKSPFAQRFFDQGLGQLHGFWYWEAERSFRQIAALDPDCAMAYWGMAMANTNNAERALKFIREAKKRDANITPRESQYIAALSEYYEDWDKAKSTEPTKKDDSQAPPTGESDKPAEPAKIKEPAETKAPTDTPAEESEKSKSEGSKSKGNRQRRRAAADDPKKAAEKKRKQEFLDSLQAITKVFPDDLEAKAFLAYYRWNWRDDVPINDREEVNALLQQVFDAEPLHPAHHYRIHLWDDPEPKRALESAALCGPAAPAIAHMWHMPGHI